MTTSWLPKAGNNRHSPSRSGSSSNSIDTAGNLFCATRTCHSWDASAWSPSRIVQISRPVSCSKPEQNAHGPGFIPSQLLGPSDFSNSKGRFSCWSEITTHRCQNGSRRSSAIGKANRIERKSAITVIGYKSCN